MANNLAGQKFGRLTAIKDVGRIHNGFYYIRTWECVCECGKKTIKRSSQLTQGKVNSCGCLRSEINRAKVILPEGEAAFNTIYGHYRNSAKRKTLEFSLSKEEFREIITKPCFYCGDPPTNSFVNPRNGNGSFIYNGIDRADNFEGYTSKNSLPCCKRCNYLKGSKSMQEFIGTIKQIYNHVVANS